MHTAGASPRPTVGTRVRTMFVGTGVPDGPTAKPVARDFPDAPVRTTDMM